MTTNFFGIKIGHATDAENHTGCTVFLCPPNTFGSVEVRGPAPGGREQALLAADKPGDKPVNAVVLTGGSAFGLATADGVMRYLSERGIGYPTPFAPVPIVPAAVVYDLGLGRPGSMPGADMGYQACVNADSGVLVEQGNVGAGAGVTVGKWGGFAGVMKGGFGLATLEEGDVVVSAAAVVNAIGDVLAADGSVLAGARDGEAGWLAARVPLRYIDWAKLPMPGTNTTLVVVATNARLAHSDLMRLPQLAHHGMAIAIRPSHTRHDGDTAFGLSTGQVEADPNLIHVMAVEVVVEAIRNAVRHAGTVLGIPGLAG